MTPTQPPACGKISEIRARDADSTVTAATDGPWYFAGAPKSRLYEIRTKLCDNPGSGCKRGELICRHVERAADANLIAHAVETALDRRTLLRYIDELLSHRHPAPVADERAEVGTNARYENGWYFCWLVERRDGSQPRWLGEYRWVTDANEAIWYARKSDAEAVCDHNLKGTRQVVVCEHGFDLRPRETALSAQPSGALERAPGGDAWLPIESAPKDGSDILVCYKHVETWCFFNAFWLEADETDEPDETGWWTYLRSEVIREKLDGVYSPTHWRPLSTPFMGEPVLAPPPARAPGGDSARPEVHYERTAYCLMEMMKAYERRIRSDCTTPEQLAARPWECAEYVAAADVLKRTWPWVAPPPSSSPSATADATLRAALEKDALMTKAEHLLRGWRRTFEEGRHGNSPINSTREWLSRFDAALAGNEGEK